MSVPRPPTSTRDLKHETTVMQPKPPQQPKTQFHVILWKLSSSVMFSLTPTFSLQRRLSLVTAPTWISYWTFLFIFLFVNRRYSQHRNTVLLKSIHRNDFSRPQNTAYKTRLILITVITVLVWSIHPSVHIVSCSGVAVLLQGIHIRTGLKLIAGHILTFMPWGKFVCYRSHYACFFWLWEETRVHMENLPIPQKCQGHFCGIPRDQWPTMLPLKVSNNERKKNPHELEMNL